MTMIELLDICQKTARLNFDVFDSTSRESFLRYPKYRTAEPRISEQESRVLMINVLEDAELHYSIETPTNETYSFSGKTAQSAQTDLSILNKELDVEVNVEFKAHNPQQKCISKDIEKLLKEPCMGLWFHVLKATNSKTVSSLIGKFGLALKEHSEAINNPEGILFYIIDLKGRTTRHFHLSSVGDINISISDLIDVINWPTQTWS